MKKRTAIARISLNLILLFMMQLTALAQKQNVDKLSFSIPEGWQQNQQPGGTQLSVTDSKTGGYVIAIITRTTSSNTTAAENFSANWTKLVKGTVQVTEEPAMQQPASTNGWEIISGVAKYTDGPATGLATLITATSHNQTASVVVMTNTQQYQDAILSFVNSLELAEVLASENNPVVNNSAAPATGTSLVGLWVSYKTESNGSSNGFPLMTGGYFRREYRFNSDGTYEYRAKDWSVFQKEILYISESGTWKVEGNLLTITPARGKGEWWSKAASNRTTEWGKFARKATYKLEPVTYSFELHYFSGSNDNTIILRNAKSTERDGNTNNNGQANEWIYSLRDTNKSLIDNPPGSH